MATLRENECFSRDDYYSKPTSVPILNVGSNRVTLLDENFKKLLNHPEICNRAISIVSIAGAFRKGKSFILNFFIKYLRKQGYKNRDWLGDIDAPLEGFHWRGGKDADTYGINIWSEPFTIKRNGREIAILIMDTQGMFDDKTEKVINAQIFALSTLLSSVQIVNLTHQIQENDLEFLEFFIGYAKAAKDSGINEKPFQSLVFFIRDWQNSDDNNFGREGGYAYLQEKLNKSRFMKQSSLFSVRDQLDSSFERMEGFLMPHPGKKVSRSSKGHVFSGCLRDIDDDFVEQIEPLMAMIVHPENVVVKKIGDKEANARLLLSYARTCNAQFISGNLPKVENLWRATLDTLYLETHLTCIDLYKKEMEQNKNGIVWTEEEILQHHEKAKARALYTFEDLTKSGGQDDKKEDKRKFLIVTMNKLFMEFSVANKHLEESVKLDIKKRKKKAVESYNKNMQSAIKKVLEEKVLVNYHNKYKQLAKDFFLKSKNQHKSFENKYLEKLQQDIEKAFESYKTANNEKRLLKKAMENEKKARESIARLTDKYQKEMKKVSDGKFLSDQQLHEHQKNIQNKIKKELTEELHDLVEDERKKHLISLENQIDLLCTSFTTANRLEVIKAETAMEKIMREVLDKAKEKIRQVLNREIAIDENEMEKLQDKVGQAAISQYNKEAKIYPSLMDEYRNQLKQKLEVFLVKQAKKNTKEYDIKMTREASAILQAEDKHFSDEYKTRMYKDCTGKYLEEDVLRQLHNKVFRDIVRMFEERTDHLYVDNGDIKRNLESNMQSMFKTLLIANENYKHENEKIARETCDLIIRSYEDKMRQELNTPDPIDEDQLQSLHETYRAEALNEYDMKSNKSVFTEEFKNDLDAMITKRFEKFEKKNARKIEAASKGEEAERLAYDTMTDSLQKYLEDMETSRKGLFCSNEQLGIYHRENSQKAKQNFNHALMETTVSPKLREIYSEKLQSHLEKDFVDQKEENELVEKVSTQQMKSLVNSLKLKFENLMRKIETDQSSYEPVDFGRRYENVVSEILDQFDEQSKNDQLKENGRRVLMDYLTGSETNYKERNKRKFEEDKKKADEELLKETVRECMKYYETSMKGLSEQVHQFEMKKALKLFSEKVEHIDDETKSRYKNDLENKMTEFFTDKKSTALAKKNAENAELSELSQRLRQDLQNALIAITEGTDPVPKEQLKRCYDTKLHDISEKFKNNSKIEKYEERDSYLATLKQNARETYQKYCTTNTKKQDDYNKRREIESANRLAHVVDKCVENYKHAMRQVGEVYNAKKTLANKHAKESREQTKQFENDSREENLTQVQKYKKKLTEKLEEEYGNVKETNNNNESILETECEEIVSAAEKEYYEKMDEILKDGYLVEEEFDKQEKQIRQEIVEYLEIGSLTTADELKRERIKTVKHNVTKKLGELTGKMKTWNKENYSFGEKFISGAVHYLKKGWQFFRNLL